MILSKIQGFIDETETYIEFAEELNPFKLPFSKAIKYANDRYPALFSKFEEITEEIREKFVWIKKSTDIEITKKLFKNLNQTLEKGGTFKSWVKNSKEVLEKTGFAENSAYLENVYHTNTMSFYNAGHYESQISNKENLPYWLYDGILDGREQDHTRLYDGKVFRADDPIWNSIYPPNGYNCRCRVIALDNDDLKKYKYKLESSNDEIIKGAKKELGVFASNPSKSYWENLEKNVEKKLKQLELEF